MRNRSGYDEDWKLASRREGRGGRRATIVAVTMFVFTGSLLSACQPDPTPNRPPPAPSPEPDREPERPVKPQADPDGGG